MFNKITYLLTYKMHKPSKVCLMAIHCNSPVDGSLVEMLLRRGKTTAKLCRKLRGKHHKLQLDQKRSPGLPDNDPPPGRHPVYELMNVELKQCRYLSGTFFSSVVTPEFVYNVVVAHMYRFIGEGVHLCL